jgi:hypothetical protein
VATFPKLCGLLRGCRAAAAVVDKRPLARIYGDVRILFFFHLCGPAGQQHGADGGPLFFYFHENDCHAFFMVAHGKGQ